MLCQCCWPARESMGTYVQTGGARCLVPQVLGSGQGRGGENPRLACWSGVLVDPSWGALNESGAWLCRGIRSQARTCARSLEPYGQAELQVSTPPHQMTGLRTAALGSPRTPGHRDRGGTGLGGREGICGRTLRMRNGSWGTSTDKATVLAVKQAGWDWVVWRREATSRISLMYPPTGKTRAGLLSMDHCQLPPTSTHWARDKGLPGRARSQYPPMNVRTGDR